MAKRLSKEEIIAKQKELDAQLKSVDEISATEKEIKEAVGVVETEKDRATALRTVFNRYLVDNPSGVKVMSAKDKEITKALLKAKLTVRGGEN